MSALTWKHFDGVHALCTEKVIVNFIRWSESGDCYVDFKGTDLGKDLDSAMQICKLLAVEALKT
jgi:hypothetical protein